MTPTEKKATRATMADYLRRSEKARSIIHYSQTRPYHGLGVPPETGFTADCSSYVTLACYWAADQSDTPLTDPNGRNYDHYGFTGTLYAENKNHPVPNGHKYLIGDMAIYGPAYATRHVVICRTAGYAADAVWSSHGSEAGPLPVRVHYRNDLLGVFRPASLL
jgi:hypothetical protein